MDNLSASKLCPFSPEADIIVSDIRFSNRPFGVKHFQTIHHCNRCRSRARASLRNRRQVLPSWDSRTRRNNLLGGLAVNRMAGPSGRANSPHPSSREGHLSTSRWSSSFLLSGFILNGFSNRPFGVKRFQTIHHCNVDVAHGLVLLFGIDARSLYGVFFVKEFAWAAKLSFDGFLV